MHDCKVKNVFLDFTEELFSKEFTIAKIRSSRICGVFFIFIKIA